MLSRLIRALSHAYLSVLNRRPPRASARAPEPERTEPVSLEIYPFF